MRSLPKRRMWGVCVFPVTCDIEHNTTQSHLTSYTTVEIKWSLGVTKIAGRDNLHFHPYKLLMHYMNVTM